MAAEVMMGREGGEDMVEEPQAMASVLAELEALLLALICIGICTRNISIPADRLRNRLARVAENDLSPPRSWNICPAASPRWAPPSIR